MSALDDVLTRQDGVISRKQVLGLGHDDNLIERKVRRREWAPVHRGVYVTHTGPVTWRQQAWAAVLVHWPAVLCGRSAVVAATAGPSLARATADPDPVEVAVDARRHVRRIEGVRVTRVLGLADHVQPGREPPRMRLEQALLRQAADAPSEPAALAGLADACQRGWTTAGRLSDALRSLPRLRRRAFLLAVLEDVAKGSYSVLEHRYLVHVERPHGLPTAARQRRARPGRAVAYRDVEYVACGCVVELDGRLGHERAGDRWRDAERDAESLLEDRVTVRLTWGQVLDPCRSAALVWRVLHKRGWSQALRPCGQGCTAIQWLDDGALPASGAGSAPSSANRAAVAQAQSWPSRRSSASSTVPS